MVKMLICLLCALGLGVMTLQLRQQRLELNYKISQLHRQIESGQAKLWNQQLQIATFTAPNANSSRNTSAGRPTASSAVVEPRSRLN